MVRPCFGFAVLLASFIALSACSSDGDTGDRSAGGGGGDAGAGGGGGSDGGGGSGGSGGTDLPGDGGSDGGDGGGGTGGTGSTDGNGGAGGSEDGGSCKSLPTTTNGACMASEWFCMDYVGSMYSEAGVEAGCGGGFLPSGCDRTQANYVGSCYRDCGTAKEVVWSFFAPPGDNPAQIRASQRAGCLDKGFLWFD